MKQFFFANGIKRLVKRLAKPAIFSCLIILILFSVGQYRNTWGRVGAADKNFTAGSTPWAITETSNPASYQLERYRSFLTAFTPGRWDSGPRMPQELGEVASGVINGVLYVVGQGSKATLAYNIAARTWRDDLAVRPFFGNHHAAEVFNGKLYLFGGLSRGEGKVQIYDPMTNTWSLGADMPFAAGSSSSAVIDGQIYVAGGIVGSSTTNQVAKYNPATNTWTLVAPMKQGRNHAASETDGTKLYVFGGRGLGSGDANVLANGFNTVQIYNPATNTWSSSLDPGSNLAPLPRARGGMGKAAYLSGKFYVIGGETKNGAGATKNNVYRRVDIYNPQTNTWQLGTPLPTARHGIFPVVYAGEIYLAGGGIKAGYSISDVFEIF